MKEITDEWHWANIKTKLSLEINYQDQPMNKANANLQKILLKEEEKNIPITEQRRHKYVQEIEKM